MRSKQWTAHSSTHVARTHEMECGRTTAAVGCVICQCVKTGKRTRAMCANKLCCEACSTTSQVPLRSLNCSAVRNNATWVSFSQWLPIVDRTFDHCKLNTTSIHSLQQQQNRACSITCAMEIGLWRLQAPARASVEA